jgi:uncharacterized protein YyaL (SSP411 family)
VSTATNAPAGAPKHTNRLALEKSPYLLQHQHNPVDWFPWGEAAFEKARREDKPILLSIGYSTCHWCHVMERESFEDEATAKVLNQHFVSIKVDREERPDLDKIYMTFVQMTTGSGGWPMNVFLTPDRQPFYGGTYWPPAPKQGRPSFSQVLARVAELWREKRSDITDSANEITARLQSLAEHDSHNAFPAGERELHGAGQSFLHEYDPHHGGFGGAPKFPRPSQPLFLLRYARRFGETDALKAVLHTCDAMARGGMYDQLGGGFARYSVDEKWLVPHFEKMLYDQAQLVQLYLDAYLVSGEAQFAEVAREVIRYVLRDLTHPGGGFYSAEDADSEGKEGKFYCWTHDELSQRLTVEEFNVATRYFGVTRAGNFLDHSDPEPLPNQNVLSLADPKLVAADQPLLEAAKAKLLAVRARRVRPHFDDKVLASWNGQMLGAVARAAVVLQEEDFKLAAERNLAFLKAKLWDAQTKTLYHRWRDGHRDDVQLLDAYANLLAGVVELYEATVDPRHLEFAVELAEATMKRFYDPTHGGFWQTTADAPHLLLRTKEDYDGAEPSGNSVAALVFLKLAAICDRKDWREAAEKTIRLFAQRLHQMPQAVPHLLLALDDALQEPKRVVLVGDFTCGSTAALLRTAHSVFEPHKVVLGNAGPVDPFAKTLPMNEEFAQAYCCTGTACRPPTRDRSQVLEFLKTQPKLQP